MRSKKVKQLKKIARAFVIQTGKPLESIIPQYKKIKKTYKSSKGQL